MADIILSPIIDMLVEKFVSPTFDKLIRYAGIHSEVKKWKESLSEIKALLKDASQKEITSESVKLWLNSIQHLAYDIEDILDALAIEAECRDQLTEESGAFTEKVRKLIPTCCTSFSVGTRMHDKLNDITTKLQELEKKKNSLCLEVLHEKPIIMKRNKENKENEENEETKEDTGLPLNASDIIVGQGEKEALLHKLLAEESGAKTFSIVPIVGMGGIGKTTLARILYNETQVDSHFKLKAWVCVSDEFNVLKISKTIFQSMTKAKPKFESLNLLQEALRQELMNKRFLLVLDDVWSESFKYWEILVRPFHVGAPGSKIIITTRKEQLLKKLNCDNLKHMQSLSHDDSLSLFCQHALGVNNFDSHPNLRTYGEAIVKKSGGLPLALTVLGRLFRTKTDEVEWEKLSNSEIWRLKEGDEIVPALRLSYHDLDACMKQLFAYCSLFPKDYLFDKEELILLWMAEGFLHHSSSTSLTLEPLGHNCFKELLSRSFFQLAPNKESLFVMHDLINDLATSVAQDFFWRSENEMETGVGMGTLEKYRHMSFVCEHYISSRKLKAFDGARNLRTFLAVSLRLKESSAIFFISHKILTNLLLEFPLLRVLSLRCLSISEVPESIGSLKHLRYLNLGQTQIRYLPEYVCNLYSLQTLIVFGCHKLTKLPNDFSKLTSLRHFDIRDTPLMKKMPSGIGELKSLQTLPKIIIRGNDDFPIITKLKDLKNFHGMISIKGLDKVQNAMHARDANLSQMRLSELEVEWGDVFDGSRNETHEKEVLDVFNPGDKNLKKLQIVSYGGSEFPKWVGDSSFDRLTHVSIRGCRKCASLPPLGELPSLKELFIQGMDEVNVVELQRLAFLSLEILSFEDMQGWEVWSTNGGIVDAVFPCLKKLCIKGCPKLVEISLEALPSLKDLKVHGCGEGVLRSLVQAASSITKLEIESISGLTDELWGGVIKHLGVVEEVSIERCDGIRYMLPSETTTEACEVLVNLKKLEIRYCENLVSLGEKEENNTKCGSRLTSLRTLDIWVCNSMEHCICSNSIESLWFVCCDSMTSISFPTGGQKQLNSVTIISCKKLVLGKDLGGGRLEDSINASMQMLDCVEVFSKNLRWIEKLRCFIHLNSLTIDDCPGLESFPEKELSNLTSLTTLRIEKCPRMDASFPNVGTTWPPNLCFLCIGGLKKPMSEWGPQNFPTSLVSLRFIREEVSSFSKFRHLLPPTLISLTIIEFEKLESLSKGLQHLTSLQRLCISICPKMKHLPETLLPSMLGLVIRRCPELEERCTRRGRGSYWPLISHIPSISIDNELI